MDTIFTSIHMQQLLLNHRSLYVTLSVGLFAYLPRNLFSGDPVVL